MNHKSDFLAELCDFLYPHNSYYGQFKPEYLVFNANLQEFAQRVNYICNLQEFAQRVNYICNLQTGGKLSPEEAYKQIHILWKQLKYAKKALEIG